MPMVRRIPVNNDSLCNVASIFAFLCSLSVYWLTADPSVSYWDCPEYVTCASRLEVGHPPGNPVWMLFMRVATMPFPASMHAWVINLCSGLFMALAVFFLARVIFMLMRGARPAVRAVASASGALVYAFCDSAWFSAVEAEVYAFSAFLTMLSVWLMLLWAKERDSGRRTRLLILLAYVTGLSLGVHQLNLLCIPVYALIYIFARHPGRGQTGRAWLAVLVSFGLVGLMLFVILRHTLTLASGSEIFAVNGLGLPPFSGVIGFCAIVLAAAVFLAVLTRRRRRLNTVVWMGGFLLLGYFSFALILVRGAASPPMNEGAPTDIFALSRYMAREQYGSRPLVYGATPFSEPMLREDWVAGDSRPRYTNYVLDRGEPRYFPVLPGARLHPRSGFVTGEDSAMNRSVCSDGAGYVLADYGFSRVTTPELDMWLPRITGSSPALLDSYASWVGMDRSTMDRVEVSSVIDTLGRPAGRIDASGARERKYSWRPTYLQNLRMLLQYQMGYMYFRYLMWNFAGRQNDIPSTGEIDHGNFITGFGPLDEAMLGRSDFMPREAREDNPGRNNYYCIPLLLGIAGIISLARGGRYRRRVLAVITLFFLMTGVAIVVYLNQTPGEPRERDYSFLGSFMAFSIWIAFGIAAFASLAGRVMRSRVAARIALAVAGAGVPLMMAVENFDDHDRRGRSDTRDFAEDILGIRPEGIIFTQGDNFTFPLWYGQEVEGLGTGHRVIDVSYLATPEYVCNIMRQGEKGLSFIATPGDILYGAYSFTRVAPDADTVPVPLADALRDLYSRRDGAPEFRHSRVTLPGLTASDTLVIDLRSLSGGRPIPFKQLMLLDILAANADSGRNLPVYFMSHLPSSFRGFLASAVRPFGQTDVYCPEMDSVSYLKALGSMATAFAHRSAASGRPEYIDPVMVEQRRYRRGALVRNGKVLLENGLPREAGRTLMLAAGVFPENDVPGGSYTVADSTFHEGLEHASLLIEVGDTLGDRRYVTRAARILLDMRRRARAWRLYHASLPEGRRSTVSDDSRRQILELPQVDSLLNRAMIMLDTK